MKKEWYKQPLRIIALQGGVGKTPLLKVPRVISSMGFNAEQGPTRRPGDPENSLRLASSGETENSLDISPGDEERFRKYLEEIKKNRLRFILYLNVHVLEKPGKHKEWAQRGPDGDFPKLYDTEYAVCLNSPWRDYFFLKLEEYAGYDIDGVFLDGPCILGGGCFCPHCKKKFSAERGAKMTPAGDRFDFYRRTQEDFLNEAYGRFKAINPGGVFYMNFDIENPAASYFSLPEALEFNDIVGTEAGFQFYSPPKNSYLWRVSTLCKLMEAVAPGRPRVNFMAADQKPWSFYMHTPAETKMCIASTAANGANLWYGPHASMDILDTPGGRAGLEMVGFLAENDKFYEGASGKSKTAVMYSFSTAKHYRTIIRESDLYGKGQNEKGEGNFTASFRGICDALSRSGIPYDIVTDLDSGLNRIDSYDCIFLPTCACLSAKAVKKLKEFVAEGKTIVGSFDTSMYDQHGKKRAEPGLKEVFGIKKSGRLVKYGRWNYFSPVCRHRVFRGIDTPLMPAPEVAFEISTSRDSEVLAYFHKAMTGRYNPLQPQDPGAPAVVLNRYKKGTGIYLAGAFWEMMHSYAPPEYRKMASNISCSFARNPVSLEKPGSVEVVVRGQGKRMLVHLVNYSGLSPRPFEAVMPLSDVKVNIRGGAKYSRIFALSDKRGCSFSREKGRLSINIKTLNEYEVIVLEEN